MLGSIIGDIVGSKYESHNIRTKDFVLFGENTGYTDDSILTLATAQWILSDNNVADCYIAFAQKYKCQQGGYGSGFSKWLYQCVRQGIKLPYNSCGNGSAMRVGPVGWAFDTEEEVMKHAGESAACTHNHPEGIKGAQAIAVAILSARKGHTKDYIEKRMVDLFDYDFNYSITELQNGYGWNSTRWGNGGLCQGSVPPAIRAFLDGNNFEDCIRTAVSIGGDSDTIACMTGSIAEAFYGIPMEIYQKGMSYLEPDLQALVKSFELKYGNKIIE